MNTYKQQFVHVKALMTLLLTASVLAGTTLAQDANPPWYRNDPHSVHANWHYSSTGDGSLDLEDFWSVDGNPDYYLHGLDVSQNVKADANNQYDFQIPNYVDDLPIKYLRLQLTWIELTGAPSPSPTVASQGVDGNDPVQVVLAFTSTLEQLTGSDLYYQYFDFEYYPNPDFERINVMMPDNTLLTDAIVDSISTIPEPATLVLLGLGGLGWLKRR